MPYYVMMSPDVKATFGSGVSKQSIITSLQKGWKKRLHNIRR